MWLLRSPEERFVATRRVLLHFTTSEQSLEGYIVKQTRDSLWLRQGKLLETKGRSFDMDGTLIVPRRSVFFVQVLAAHEAL
jgi:hypothetical protein